MSKKIMNVFTALVLSFVVIFGLVGCGNSESKVKFIVQNEYNEWVVLSEESIVNGEVQLAEAPRKAYYTFAGWFCEEELATPFTGKDLKASAKAYAKYTPNQVKVTINGEDLGSKNLIDIINAEYNPGEGLEFNGWYKDPACKVQWDGKEDVKALYAESVAIVTYSNGYETLHTEMVKPGTVLGKPSERVVEDSNFEAKYIVKEYMSSKNLSYTFEGKDIDFSKPITKSMDVEVLWNSNIPDYAYKKSPRSGNYYLESYSLPDAPVVSLRSNVTIMVKEGNEENAPEVAKDIVVEGLMCNGSGLIKTTTKKLIFGEGIKFVKGVSGEAACNVESVVLPSSLEIIDASFNNMPLVKEFNIPEGVQIIIGSFWQKSSSDYKNYYLGSEYDFEINVPASVKNLCMVPANLTFAKESNFAKEDGRIVLNRGNEKILISDPAAYQQADEVGRSLSDTIVVPEGITGIQVGTYNTIFNYLILPSTFKTVNYNENFADYTYYVFQEGSSYSMSANMLYDETAKNDPSSTMGPNAYTITYNLGGYGACDFSTWVGYRVQAGKVIFAGDKLPEGLDPYAFACDPTGFAFMNGKYQPMYTVVENEDGTQKQVLNSALIFSDNKNVAYITSTLRYEANGNPMSTTINLEKAALNPEEIKAEIIAGMPADQQAKLETATLKFYVNNEEVTLGTVTTDMFITAVFEFVPMLTINSSYRLSCDEYGTISNNPAEFSQDYLVDYFGEPQGTVAVQLADLTGLSKESIMSSVLEAVVASLLWVGEDEAVIRDNIKWSYDNAVSIKIMMNGEEVTDFSKITLENGDVTIDVVVEYTPYTTQA